MKIKALVPWFGSKRNMAPKIIEELGEHRAYWEPFCGSMAVLLAKPAATMETVNDLNGDLINLSNVLVKKGTAIELYENLSRMFMHEELFREAAQRWRDRGRLPAPRKPDVNLACDYFICSWMGRNGVAGTHSYNQGFCARYTKNGGHAATRFVSAVESIPDWHQRMRQVTILSRDAFELIDKIEDAPCVCMYVDPPYIEKGAKYIHDFEQGDHARLADCLSRFKKTRVVLSYYDHESLGDLYPGWTKVEHHTRKSLANASHRRPGKTIAPEILLINGPSLVEAPAGSLFA